MALKNLVQRITRITVLHILFRTQYTSHDQYMSRRVPRFTTIVSPIHPARPGGLRSFNLKLDETIFNPPDLKSAIRPISTSSVSNVPSLRQKRSGGRSSASQPKYKVFSVLLSSQRGTIE